MSIYKNAVRKPITTLMIFLAVVVFGGYSLMNLPVDLYPEIEFPAITVFTTYPGANAADIETNISRPIEDVLNSVDGLKEISSVSRDNISVVTLEFEFETDLSEASNDIRDALSLVETSLPEGADKPGIFKFSSSMMPILMFAVTADENYEGLEKILDEKIINPLNRVDGIGSLSIMGAPGREITVEIDPHKLESYNLTVEQIGGILQAENINMPAGNVKMGNLSYPLRVQGEFEDSEDIKKVVLGNFNGQAIYLEDVAMVRDSVEDKTLDERINGKEGVRLMIMKQSGANTVQVARDIKNELEELKKTLPEDIEIIPIFDTSEFINGSINNLTQTLMYALMFVTLVVLFFLGRWRATFIIVLTIPISLIVAFIFLYVTGNSVNVVSLSALSIAIGMVVDDAIVVLENISKHIERGSSPGEAAIYATNEVWLAVIITTLTVVAVFFPMTLISGMTGVLFRQLGWIVTITVITSTVAAISLTPMLSSKLLKSDKFNKKTWFDKVLIPVFDGLDTFYERTIRWSLRRKWLILITALALFIGSLMAAANLGTEFMPETDQGQLTIEVELQSGTRVEKTVEVARQVDAFLEAIPEVQLISTSSGSDDSGGFISIFRSGGTNIINYTLKLSDMEDRDRSVWEIAEVIRKELIQYPQIINFDISTGGGGFNFGGTTLDVEIFGYDLDETTQLANELAERVKKLEGARNVQISREKAKPELRVDLDREKMAAFGLNTATVSTAIYNRVEGLTATKFRETGDEYDIIIRFKEEFRNSLSDIENISVQNHNGLSIRISEIGRVTEYWGPPNIERQRRERVVTVSVTPYNTSMGELAAQIQAELDQIDKPQSILTQIGGAFEDQQEGFMDLGLLLVLSLILVYIVMASQFESLKMPFIIMFSIPFAFTGVIFALLLTNTTLSIIAALGAVMLVGIVVKNAIVLVDYINLMRDRGHSLDEAIIISAKSRLRPVLMTALTTILGMLPLALSTGKGSEIWSPMGISVIGGLIFSTVITMVIVPVIYRILGRSGERKKMKAAQSKYTFTDKN